MRNRNIFMQTFRSYVRKRQKKFIFKLVYKHKFKYTFHCYKTTRQINKTETFI